jgi:hypothetical protein
MKVGNTSKVSGNGAPEWAKTISLSRAISPVA